ncbi:hypothetical protein [Dethiothermospora halolimnae]|uniref:hypothetical protein n=1 Tax=Dethiothermospora halolimnae TaxID=3114390 RepID=UPI003CCBEE18
MLLPVVIGFSISLISIIIIGFLEKTKKLKERSKIYMLIGVIGVYIPIFAACGYYFYMKTDTLKGAIIVISGVYICLILLELFNRVWGEKKYNYVTFAIVVLTCYFIINYITSYMLSKSDKNLFIIVAGFILGGKIIDNCKNKKKLIISGIIVMAIVIIEPLNYIDSLKKYDKVESTAIEYVESIDYPIEDDYKIIRWNDSIRNKPISLSIIQKKSEDKDGTIEHIKMTYFNGKIIKLEERP